MALPVRRAYKGTPVITTLSGSISDSASSCTVVSITGWPTTFPFFAVIAPGTVKEEKVLVTGASGNTFSITRSQDNTNAPENHAAGSVMYPVFTATEADEANLVASAMTTKGDLIVTDGLTINRLGVGTNAHVLQADSTAPNGVKWAQVGTTNIADSAVTSAKIADSAVTSAKIADGTIVLADLAAALQAFLVPTGSINGWSTNTAPTGWQLCDGSAVSRSTFSALFAVIGTTYGAGDGSTTFNLPNLKGRVLVGRDAAQTEFDTLGETGGAKTHTLTTAEIPGHQHNVSAYSHSVSQSDALGTHDHTFSGSVTSDGAHSHSGTTDTGGSHNHVAATYTLSSQTHGHGAPNYASAGSTSGTLNGTLTVDTHNGHQHTFSTNTVGHSHTYSGTTGASANLSHGHSVSVNNHDAKLTDANTGGGGAHNNLQPYIVLNYIIKN